MSLEFSNTTTKGGIIQRIERSVGFNDGEISGNTTRLAQFTSDVNNAFSEVMSIIFNSTGNWQWDDNNHTDYPIIQADLASGQADYTFTEDENDNLILDIYKVQIKDSTGDWKTLESTDRQTTKTTDFSEGDSGTPIEYDLTGNGIFLNPKPNYASSGGLQIFVNREGSFFTTSDTTKKAGFMGIYHEYLVLKPAYDYARAHTLPQRNILKEDLMELERRMTEHFAKRERGAVRRLIPNVESTR